AVEKVVSGNEHEAERADRPARQEDEPGECHHRPANRPNDLEIEGLGYDAEGNGESDHGELENDEPEPAREEEAAGLPTTSAAVPEEVCRHTREEDESGRTEMSDPPREEQRRIADIAWVERASADEIAHVVERHDHHDEPTHEVD